MVGFIFGISLMFNIVFIGLWMYGWQLDKKNVRQIKKKVSVLGRDIAGTVRATIGIKKNKAINRNYSNY